jgi:hypothetical protein
MCGGLASFDVSEARKSKTSRIVQMPIAADDVTYEVLRVGNWYHRRGKPSDRSTAEWGKLPPDLQKEYVKVRGPEDLGEEVRTKIVDSI